MYVYDELQIIQIFIQINNSYNNKKKMLGCFN